MCTHTHTHIHTQKWYKIALYERHHGVRCRHKAFRIIWCAELLVKKKEREETMCMCMRIYMCDMYHRIYSIYMYIDVSTLCPGVLWPPLSTIITSLLRWASYCISASNAYCDAFLYCLHWRKKLFRMFGPELIRINLLIKTARSAVSKNRVERCFLFCGVSRDILKTWH